MAEKKKTRAEERFEREAKMLQKNLEKRKKQQAELNKQKQEREQRQNGQA
uniref:Uncharacterized protein n=1 Tax=uncultured Alphaproteobacteria bacterium TaxID=91750 RepID=A0A6G8F1Z6_9PROT|nr:hypothetical protein PlAlph_1090 [uncultured Alphaproteobacteria bacterium]